MQGVSSTPFPPPLSEAELARWQELSQLPEQSPDEEVVGDEPFEHQQMRASFPELEIPDVYLRVYHWFLTDGQKIQCFVGTDDDRLMKGKKFCRISDLDKLHWDVLAIGRRPEDQSWLEVIKVKSPDGSKYDSLVYLTGRVQLLSNEDPFSKDQKAELRKMVGEDRADFILKWSLHPIATSVVRLITQLRISEEPGEIVEQQGLLRMYLEELDERGIECPLEQSVIDECLKPDLTEAVRARRTEREAKCVTNNATLAPPVDATRQAESPGLVPDAEPEPVPSTQVGASRKRYALYSLAALAVAAVLLAGVGVGLSRIPAVQRLLKIT